MSDTPAPEVEWRDAEPGEIPRAANGLIKAAHDAGWGAWVTYARGTYPWPKKEPAVVDSIVLRLRKDGRRAVAMWLDGGFTSAYAWGNGEGEELRSLGARALKLALTEDSWTLPAPTDVYGDQSIARAHIRALLLDGPVHAGTWGAVHVGDIVRGADQRGWQVVERGPAVRWLAKGNVEAPFTLTRDDREVTTIRPLAERVDVMQAADHSAEAAAFTALADAGLAPEVISETTIVEPAPMRVNEWDDSIGAPAPCMPIGCDNGTHIPGCVFAARDEIEAPNEAALIADAEAARSWAPGEREALIERAAQPVPMKAVRPCDDPFCGPLADGGCGWAPVEHRDPSRRTPALITDTNRNKEINVADPFTSALPPVKRDHNKRYLLPDPVTGEERSWMRVSTLAKTLADTFNLELWAQRMIARGVAIRPDLAALAASADPNDYESFRNTLNSVAKQAKDAAKASSGSNFGTAMHSFIQRLDAGERLADMHAPEALRGDLAGYVSALRATQRKVRPEYVEQIVILPDIGVAGTFDRLVEVEGQRELEVFDLKTAKDPTYSWLEPCIQLACYAHGAMIFDRRTQTYKPMPPIDLTRASVLHLPIGKGTPTLYGLNIVKGWAWVQASLEARQIRKEAKSAAWLIEPTDPHTLALLHVSRASSREDLAALWERLNARGLWTQEVNDAAMARAAQIAPTLAPATV